MNGLNKNVEYYFAIDAFNAGGVAENRRVISAEK